MTLGQSHFIITTLNVVELICMLLSTVLSLLVWRQAKKTDRIFFFWLSASMIFFAIGELSALIPYNNTFFNLSPDSEGRYFEIGIDYLSFGTIIYAYSKVLNICNLVTWRMSRVFLSAIPLLLMIVLIVLAYSLMFPWSRSNTALSIMEFISMMEQLILIGVLLFSVCMLRIGKLYCIYMSALLAMSADMVYLPRHWYYSNMHTITYHAILVVSILVYLVGLWLIYRKVKQFNLRDHFVRFNSFQAQMVLFGFTMTALSLILFIILEIFLPSIPFFASYENFILIPSLLIVFAILSMIFSSILAKVINHSFLGINKLIKVIADKKLSEPLLARRESPIEEFNQLEKVLLQGRKALLRNIEAEHMFSNLATYFAHGIRSPLITLELLFSELPN